MCFAMQEQPQHSEETSNKENSGENEAAGDDVASTGDAQAGSAEGAADPELDPWEALELEAAKWKDQAIRTAAELDNFRKRMTREKLDAVRYGNQRLLEELLPVLDNFEMGMQAAAQEQGSMLYMGMDMVHKQIGEFFTSQNVTEIPASVGDDFDPNQHEAIGQEESDDVEEGKIVRIVRKGYCIGDRLLRPANVIVALGVQPSESSENQDQPESE